MATTFTKDLFSTTYKDDFTDSANYHRILFNSGNALQARDSCFHLYLNENYSLREVDFIVENLKKVESRSLI